MKKIILLIALMASLQAKPMNEQRDKQLHFAGSALISASVTAYSMNQGCTEMESLLYGVGASLLVGLAKEAYDQADYGGASADDLYADLGGAVLGSIVSVQFNWEF